MRKIAGYHFVENKYLRRRKGKRKSHCYSLALRGLIFALKLEALTPYDASEVLKQELNVWFGKGVRFVRQIYGKKLAIKYREYVKLAKTLIFDYIDSHPKDFCRFLTRFDLDFCMDYAGPWSIFFEMAVFLLVQWSVDKSLKKKFKERSLQIEPLAKELLSTF
ncbi:hypothetical protein GTO27_01205 [Candidatus Bathyarchaeota archaeon]|nr:hypothetical protein [Candidatus Bathyarchaeota archaeon]